MTNIIINKMIKHRRLISILLLIVTLFTCLSNIVLATEEVITNYLIDTEKTASLTIVKYENAVGTDKSSENNPLEGVTFTIYKIDSDNFDREADDIYSDIVNDTISLENTSLTTGENGIVIFENLSLGRYLIAETESPKNVTEVIKPFLIDLPRSNESGTGWDYDVTVYPKNETIYGDVTLNKVDFYGNPLEGTTWELQVKENDTWSKYEYDGILTTDKNGQIYIENLPVGYYRLVETSTLEGYILDQSDCKEFLINSNQYTFSFTSTNEKLELEKNVKAGSTYEKNGTANINDAVSWQINADVPYSINYKENVKTYYITDTLPNSLDYVEDSLSIYAIDGTPNFSSEEGLYTSSNIGTLLDSSAYTVSYSNNVLTIKFDLSKLSENTYGIIINFDTSFNENVTYGEAQINSATITYTNNIDINGNEISTYTTEKSTAEVHTGAVLIKKVDNNGAALEGAKFKIATTEENAKKGIFVKESNGEDIEIASDENGYVLFTGLAYGSQGQVAEAGESSYYIVETESPTYIDENGETKHYNLLSDPVEVKINSNSDEYSSSTVEIVNKKGFVLPLTGGTGAIFFIAIGASIIGIALTLHKKNKKKK